MYIAKISVLENESKNEREKIFLIIVNNLFDQNRYNKNPYYYSTLAQLVRALYFYSKYEIETLSPSYRAELETLCEYGEYGKNNYKITLSSLVKQNVKEVIQWLIDDAIHYNGRVDIFDYFPTNFYCKNAVWDQGKLLRFAFLIYCVYAYKIGLFPVNQAIKNSTDLKKRIYMIIMDMSNEEFQLNDSVKTEVQQIQSFLGTKFILSNNIFNRNFKFFNEQLSIITEQQNHEGLDTVCTDIKEIFEQLKHQFENYPPFQFNPQIDLKNGQKINIRSDLQRFETNSNKFIGRRKVEQIKYILNTIVDNKLPSQKIEFDFLGLKNLLLLLQENEMLFTNLYINDALIDVDTKKSDEYSKLKDILQKVQHVDMPNLNFYVFLKQKSIEFNISLIENSLKKPTNEQCQEYIKSFKIAEGKYRIDHIIYDFAGAINYVQNNYKSENLMICIATNIESNSGFKVMF